jgi:hypothetical protein
MLLTSLMLATSLLEDIASKCLEGYILSLGEIKLLQTRVSYDSQLQAHFLALRTMLQSKCAKEQLKKGT